MSAWQLAGLLAVFGLAGLAGLASWLGGLAVAEFLMNELKNAKT